MTTLEGLAKQVERQARALEQLVERFSNAALPLCMSKVRAAAELDISVDTLDRLIVAGVIKLTKHKKVPASELLRYAAVAGREPSPSKAEKYDARAVAQQIRAQLKRRRAH